MRRGFSVDGRIKSGHDAVAVMLQNDIGDPDESRQVRHDGAAFVNILSPVRHARV
jgi:hypothetical protein